ncbi:FYVE, RhoGEF and PH domain-containing protein 6 [Denticeps clupeoides]|uniref:FYVE, RhoGEF and PH domain containing 6 n=1 Tax=Denticeps clupeoides TaxID=299321 RepID=A0AAY4DT93_9TELE|nr:FYVE, RhoGEF and PH domain-containing protein 6 [Denticeps clupeoides]
MSSGAKKPPVAPKPKVKPPPPPVAPKPDLPLIHPSPVTTKKPKPTLAPKPCTPKSPSVPPNRISVARVASRTPPLSRPPAPHGAAPHPDTCSLLNSKNCLWTPPSPKGAYIIPTLAAPEILGEDGRNGHSLHQPAGTAGEDAEPGAMAGDTLAHASTRPEETEKSVCATGGGESTPASPQLDPPADPELHEASWEKVPSGVLSSRPENCPSSSSEDTAAPPYPAPPSKALPVPIPRKPRRSELKRQDRVDTPSDRCAPPEQPLHPELGDLGEVSPGDVPTAQDGDAGTHENDHETDHDPPVPPPRQKSLTSKPCGQSLDNLLDPKHAQEPSEDVEEEEEEEEEEECGYGNFARYPFTRSLPKQIKFRGSPLTSAELRLGPLDDKLPRAAPRKPQRHSMPAKQSLATSPEQQQPPESVAASPAPPQDKPTWRLPLPIALFRRNPLPRGHAGVQKQRAHSFSSADLAGRSERSSFQKLLELRMSIRLLPRLLIKSSQSLDCTSAQNDAEQRGEGRTCVDGQVVAPSECDDGMDTQGPSPGEDPAVEYENVPYYEEIPAYMNLQIHRLSWPPAASSEDVYEMQEPYQHQGKSDRGSGGGSLLEEEESSTDEGDDNSSTSSKHDPDRLKDREHEQEVKRKKVVHIAKEIMSSEKVFVDVLKLLHIDFRDAVAQAARQMGKSVIEERVLNQILYYLPQLYELNKDLLKELEERVAHWSDYQRLADIFVQKGPYLKMYSTYIREFDRNVALLDEQCRKNPSFTAVLREFEMSPRCANLALKHYLLKPVQRIPQYQLLLTDYLKNLPEDSMDYKDTQTALSVVKEVANHANDIMKQGDNFQKLMQIQYSLNGHHEIVQPGRMFLKEGILMKLSRKVMQPRMFFLFNDGLLYTTPVQSGQYKLNCMLSLAGMKVSKPSQEAYQNELNIESVERSFILSASAATERDEWLDAISKAIEDYTRKKITFISSRSQEESDVVGEDSGVPLGSKAPIWIPDLRATMCMICTCEFTLTWRRHHCRACGKVVCQACSSNKFYLEYLKHQPARVCDQCFSILQHKNDQSTATSASPGGRSSTTTFSFSRKQKKIPSALKEVSASTEDSSMSGYLMRSKRQKKPWKRLWFVIKNKVLYTYAASEDVAALESQPLLGFFLREEKTGPAQKLQFKLYHKNTLYYIFKAEDIPTAQRWIEAFQEAMIL